MNVGRLHRVLKLIVLLEGDRFLNARQLATECGVSRRTVHRDLNLIEKAGIPFYYDPQAGGYRIHQAGLLPPINLDLEEALAVVLMASELGRTGRLPLFQPASDAAAKIESALPLALRATVGSLVRHMTVRPSAVARHNALHRMYDAARRAVQARESLDCAYISFYEGGQIRLRLDPYWLLFHERAWYVIGHSHRAGEIRTYKLGRFKTLERTGRYFRLPAGLTLEKHLGNAWRMIRGTKTYRVELKFSPRLGPNVAEVNWHRTQKVRWDDEGAVYFTATVDGLSEIVWWVLGYGPHVEVLKPKALRDRVAGLAREMLALYEPA